MASPGRDKFRDGSLENWDLLGSGGFGLVYSADHKVLGKVAIKIAHDGGQSALCREADYMEAANQQYVPMVHGMYKGRIPACKVKREGIVMELMEGGSLENVLKTLSKPPPWPLAFRLAHQVAVAMAFLHKNDIVHMDLKPDNVLLDANLNAKIADFGLSTVSNSVLATLSKVAKGGTLAYTPPEAFEDDYHRVRSYDIFSYAILLWAIMTGEKPYAGTKIDHSYLKGMIQLGDRPPLDKIDVHQAAGLEDLVELMERCWNDDPEKRPPFTECIEVTSRLLSRHEEGIDAAVSEVQKVLKPEEGSSSSSSSSSSVPTHEEGIDAAAGEIQANLQEEKHTVSGPDGPVTVEPRLQSSSSGPMSSGNPLRTEKHTVSGPDGPVTVEPRLQSSSSGPMSSGNPLRTEKHTVSGPDGPVTVEPRLQSSSSGPMSSGNPLRTDSCQLSLDENTASDELILENRKVVHGGRRQRRPEHPHRFTYYPQVLSKESLPERSYFELKWEGEHVGVAVSYIDISREGRSSLFGLNDKSWMLRCGAGSRYSFYHNSIRTELSGPDLSTGGSRGKGVFGVHTDHRAGTVSFYCVDGDKQTLLHTVNTTFTQPLYAGICVYEATAEICEIW